MARTEEAIRLTRAHTAQQNTLRAGTLQDLLAIWRVVDPTNLRGTIDTFTRAAVILAQARHADSSALAATYFRLFRTAEFVPGLAVPLLAARLPPDLAAAAVRGAALAGIVDARRAGKTLAVAQQNGFVRAAGAMSKLVAAGARMTLIGSVAADRQALGWARVVSGGCAFCRMLASRGPVYKSKRSADFPAHDGCACGVEPMYEGDKPTEQSEQLRRQWQAAQDQARESGDASSGTSNDALNNYRRYLAGGAGDGPRAGTE